MKKISITGLIISGTYVALSLLSYGCGVWCPTDDNPGHHGNTALLFLPFLPAHNLFWYVLGRGNSLVTWANTLPRQLFVFLATIISFYCVGWIVGLVGSALKRSVLKLSRWQ